MVTVGAAACPGDTEWVVVTNGDNDYAPSFFDHISAATNHDLIAFDFYTRYHRSTGNTSKLYSCLCVREHEVKVKVQKVAEEIDLCGTTSS